MRYRKLLFWILFVWVFLHIGVAYCYNDLDKIPKVKGSLVKKMEKAGLIDACALLSNDKIKLYPELFKAAVMKCPQCGSVCKLVESNNGELSRSWLCPKCKWTREIPETYGAIFTPESIMRGKKFILKNEDLLIGVEHRYGVSKEIIASVSRVETNFGNFLSPTMRSTGKQIEVVNAILSWIVHGRWYKKPMYERELTAWYKVCWTNSIDPYNIGSICGASGIVQFMPTSYLKWAVDWDGDGRIDLYSLPDAMASCANYLKENGWKQNHQPSWYRTIMAYNADRSYTRSVLKYADLIKSYGSLKEVSVIQVEKISGE